MGPAPKIFKKCAFVFASLFVVLVLLLGTIPFFINVDDYRPTIIKLAEEHLDGKLELGKLSLSLWGQIKVNVAGFALVDAKGRKVVSAKDVFFHVPLAPIFTGSPVVTFKLENPEIRILKDAKGKMNVVAIVKDLPASKTDKSVPPPVAEKAKPLPGLVTRARLGVEMRHADFLYKDELTQLSSEVKDLNVIVKNLSMTKATELEIWAELDTRMGKTLTLKGPLKIKGGVEPEFVDSQFKSAQVSLFANLDGVEIVLPGLFEKKRGMATNLKTNFSLTPDSLSLAECAAKFFNVEVTMSGKVTGFAQAKGPTLALNIKSNEIALGPWSELLPLLKDYQLAGTASLGAQLSGEALDPKYRANLAVKEVTAKAPHLKTQPRIDAEIKVVTDNVESMGLLFKAPGNELRVSGRVSSFKKPKIEMTVSSSGMDLDSLIDFPKTTPPAKEEAKKDTGVPTAASGKSEKPSTASTSGSTASAADFDQLLQPLRENEIAGYTTANIKFNLNSMKAYGVKMTEIGGQLTFKDLVVGLQNFKMGLWAGNIKANMDLQMKPKIPTYHFNAEVASLNIQQAVESQLALFKNTLLGVASFKISGEGASLNPEPAKKNLNAKGSMRVDNATFATMDIAKMVGDGINKAMNDIAAKVPALKGKTVAMSGNTESKYAYISSDFTIAGGKFSAPNFVAKAEPNKGIDLTGNTAVGLLDFGLKADWQVIDTYNLTHARDLSVDQMGVKVDHILAEGDAPVKFPVKVSGTCMAPQFSYEAMPEALGKVAFNNFTRGATNKAKAEVQKKLEEQIKPLSNQAPKQLQDALKGLFGK